MRRVLCAVVILMCAVATRTPKKMPLGREKTDPTFYEDPMDDSEDFPRAPLPSAAPTRAIPPAPALSPDPAPHVDANLGGYFPSFTSSPEMIAVAILLALPAVAFALGLRVRERAAEALLLQCHWLKAAGGSGRLPLSHAPAAARAAAVAYRSSRGGPLGALGFSALSPPLHAAESEVFQALLSVPQRLQVLLEDTKNVSAAEDECGDMLGAAAELKRAVMRAGGGAPGAEEVANLMTGLCAAQEAAAEAAKRGVQQQRECESMMQLEDMCTRVAGLRDRLAILGFRNSAAHRVLDAEAAALAAWGRALRELLHACRAAQDVRDNMRSPFAPEIKALRENSLQRARLLLQAAEPALLLTEGRHESWVESTRPQEPGTLNAPGSIDSCPMLPLQHKECEDAASRRALELQGLWESHADALLRARATEEEMHASTGQRRFNNCLLREEFGRLRAAGMMREARSEREQGDVQRRGEATLRGVADWVHGAREQVHQLVILERSGGAAGGAGAAPGFTSFSGGTGGGQLLRQVLTQLQQSPLSFFDSHFTAQLKEQERTTSAVSELRDEMGQRLQTLAKVQSSGSEMIGEQIRFMREDASAAREADIAERDATALAALCDFSISISIVVAVALSAALQFPKVVPFLDRWFKYESLCKCLAAVCNLASAFGGERKSWWEWAFSPGSWTPWSWFQSLWEMLLSAPNALSCGTTIAWALACFFLASLLVKPVALALTNVYAAAGLVLVLSVWRRAVGLGMLVVALPHLPLAFLAAKLRLLRSRPGATRIVWMAAAVLLGFAGALIATQTPLLTACGTLLGALENTLTFLFF